MFFFKDKPRWVIVRLVPCNSVKGLKSLFRACIDLVEATTIMDMGSLLGTTFGTIVNYKMDPYVHC